jgi:transcriptional regulator with XRE-family HTH domain
MEEKTAPKSEVPPVCERLPAALAHAGMTDTEFTRRAVMMLSISKQAVGKILNGGSRNFKAENLFAAARILKVNPEWLATGRGPMADNIPLGADVLEVAVAMDAVTDPERREEVLGVAYRAATRRHRPAPAASEEPQPTSQPGQAQTPGTTRAASRARP